jgi:type IV secretion system protein VirB10
VVFIVATKTRPHAPRPPFAADDLEQQKYDAQQRENEQHKAAQLRNDAFLMRKEDDTNLQLNSLMSQLQKNADLPIPSGNDKQIHAEEEAIAGVLRDPRAAPNPGSVADEPRRPQRSSGDSGSNESRGGDQPVFIYSRTFGGAKYVDTPKQSAGPSAAPKPEAQNKEALAPKPALSDVAQKAPDKPSEDKTTIIYTDLPPVTLFEGEMMDAVLVNRIIADTEPSPVVCQISKDVFDNSGRYVVFPANSRLVGLSQAVNYKGAHRLFISFQRIIFPNGPAVDFPGSRKALKALDQTGALGVVSHVDRHWFLQFGTAILVGVLDGLAGAAQRRTEIFSQSSIIMDRTSRNFERILDTIMAQYSSIVPTITVHQGHKMKIYLSDDVLISPYAEIKDRSYYAHR